MKKSMEQAKFEAEICGIRELINEKFDRNKEDHEKIIEQTTKTNGSVRDLQRWRSYILGALSVISIIIIPVAFMVLESWIN
jgi:hypothetical protein